MNPHLPQRRRPAARLAAVVVSLTVLALTGCGAEDEPTPGSDGTSEAVTIRITIEGDTVTPQGERLEIPAGEPVNVVVESDRAGSMHVHSTPEQEIAYEEGTTETELTIDQPGVVEVESHDPDLVVLQLEVR